MEVPTCSRRGGGRFTTMRQPPVTRTPLKRLSLYDKIKHLINQETEVAILRHLSPDVFDPLLNILFTIPNQT